MAGGKERHRQPACRKPSCRMSALETRRELTVLRRAAEVMSRCRHGATEPSRPSAPSHKPAWRHRCAIEATCKNAPQSGKSPRTLRFAPPRPYCGICRRIASTYAAPYTERCVPLRVTSPTSIYSSISSGTEIIDAPLSSALITPEHTV